MSVKEILKNIIERQHQDKKILVDLQLYNGNIYLKSFHILEFNEANEMITGITLFESYASVREERSPVYSTFQLSEIKEITELDFDTIVMPAIEL